MATKVSKLNSALTNWQDRDFSVVELDFLSVGVANNRGTNDDLKVIQRAAGANMSVDVNSGVGYVQITKLGYTWKTRFENTATINVPIANNATGATRVDAIIMRVDVDGVPDANAANIGTVEVILGTSAVALSDGAIQTAIGNDGFYRLADIAVPNSASSIVTAYITDQRAAVTIGRNAGGYKSKFAGDGSALTGIVADLTDISTLAAIDQSQATQNTTVELGEANATSKKNRIAQSFVPAKSKLRSILLYKIADTGTFTGTVKVAIQADNAGNPSGSDLASVTLTNLNWKGTAVGEFEAILSSELTVTIGSTYWIVVTPSTSDNSNHPNLGKNSAGGYASGALKYWNVTDGHVALTGEDLYFKTREGVNNQQVKTDATGFIPKLLFDVDKMPIPMYQHFVNTTGGMAPSNNEASEQQLFGGCSTPDGSVVVLFSSGLANRIERYARDDRTGMYVMTHSIAPSSMTTNAGHCIVGSFVYEISDGGTNMAGRRWNLADLTGETAMTLPVIALSGTQGGRCWTDGVFIYALFNASNTVYKFSISGTTLSTVTTGSAATVMFQRIDSTAEFMFDGKNIYITYVDGTSNNLTIAKLDDEFGSSLSGTTAIPFNPYSINSATGQRSAPIPLDSKRFYLAKRFFLTQPSSGTTVQNYVLFTPCRMI